MIRFRNTILLGLLLLILGTVAAPGTAAQNTWGAFWDGMQPALGALEMNPTQAYFDTLYATDFTNRDALFQNYTAEANALSDMKVEYPIFIFQDARAAYQRVVTGNFTQPYVIGDNSLPPTNTPIRWVTQGMMDVNGSGQIYADYSVLDGFAKFQDLGALQLAPGQEHGQIGLPPYDVSADQPQGDTPDWQYDVVMEIAQLLTVDANGNDATSLDFDPTQIVQFGFDAPRFSPAPEIRLDATVVQDDWQAGYLTFTTPPDTTIAVDIFAQPLTAPDPLRIPVFVFLHTNENNVIDQAFLNVDLLGITNQLQINPTTIPLSGDQQAADDNGEASSDEAGSEPSPDLVGTDEVRGTDQPRILDDTEDFYSFTVGNVEGLTVIGTFTEDEVQDLAQTQITPEMSENDDWLIQTAQTGIIQQSGGIAAFEGTTAAVSIPDTGVLVANTLTNEQLGSCCRDLPISTLVIDPAKPVVYAASTSAVVAYNYETGEETVFETTDADETTYYAGITPSGEGIWQLTTIKNVGGALRVDRAEIAGAIGNIEGTWPSVTIDIDTGAGDNLKRALLTTDGRYVIGLDANDLLIGAWDTSSGEQLPILYGEGTPQPVTAVNTDLPGLLQIGTEAGELVTIDLSGGEAVSTVTVGTAPIISVSVNPDNTLISTFSIDNTMAILATNVTGGSEVAGAQSTEESAASCPVNPRTNANIRSQPDATSARVATANADVREIADGVTQAADGFTWYHLLRGGWIRGDLVDLGVGCENLPTMSGS